MKDKKIRVDFNVSSVKPTRSKVRHYSYKDVAQKLDLYSRFAKTKTQVKDMRDLKDNHFKGKAVRDAKRGIQNQHFYPAFLKGYHTPNQKINFEAVNREQDKQEHIKVLNTGKALYRHYSLSRGFLNAKRNRTRVKDRSMNKA